MHIKSNESEVLQQIQNGQLPLTASVHVDGFRKCSASQIPAVRAWIDSELRGFTPLTAQTFLSAAQTLWYLRRDGEVYGPLSQQAILRLSATLLDGDEVFSLAKRVVFIPSELQRKPLHVVEKAA